jgi:hypothetical protein
VLPEIFKNGQHQSHNCKKIVSCGGGPIVHLQIRDDLSLSPNAKMGIKNMPVRFDKVVCFGKDHNGILAGGQRSLVAKEPRSMPNLIWMSDVGQE